MMDDQPTNFYMLGTMGLASSIGLGLALTQKANVIAIDGDGSVLTNLGTLPTIGNNPCPNFTLLIIDNGSYGSTGDQPTYAGKRTSLAKMAEAAGCENVIECSAEETAETFKAAVASDQMTIIVSKMRKRQHQGPGHRTGRARDQTSFHDRGGREKRQSITSHSNMQQTSRKPAPVCMVSGAQKLTSRIGVPWMNYWTDNHA